MSARLGFSAINVWPFVISPTSFVVPVRKGNDDRIRRASYDTKLETIQNCEASGKPTTEEVHAWGHSFDKLMKTPAGRNVFREFLRTEYSEENMLFWLACEDLKNEVIKKVIEEKVRMIYEDYISILSPKEVSFFKYVLSLPPHRSLPSLPLTISPQCSGPDPTVQCLGTSPRSERRSINGFLLLLFYAGILMAPLE
uniref:RGS domain-containing protein n=1 Tax=Callorhinchus milii TaxID=7868 RepID=A0A4W3IFE4_CALMI